MGTQIVSNQTLEIHVVGVPSAFLPTGHFSLISPVSHSYSNPSMSLNHQTRSWLSACTAVSACSHASIHCVSFILRSVRSWAEDKGLLNAKTHAPIYCHRDCFPMRESPLDHNEEGHRNSKMCRTYQILNYEDVYAPCCFWNGIQQGSFCGRISIPNADSLHSLHIACASSTLGRGQRATSRTSISFLTSTTKE